MLNRLRRSPFFGPLINILTLLGLIFFFYYFLRLWYHYLAYDPGFLDFTASVATVVALIPLLGLQTEWGRDVARGLGQIIPLNRWLPEGDSKCLVLWLLVGLMVGCLHWGYPYLAHQAKVRGAQALRDGDYSVALDEFRWAVNLSPEDAQAHYNLGNTVEALHDHESAIDAYRQALAEDDELWPAYNNLGRLYLSALDDPDAALLTLHAGLTKVNDPQWKAVLRKNIGWAHLEKGQPHAALRELRAVAKELEQILARQDTLNDVSIYLAETYRLIALTHEALAQKEEAKLAWQRSQGYAQHILESTCQSAALQTSFECLNARIWMADAAEQLIESVK